jgi:lysozyme
MNFQITQQTLDFIGKWEGLRLEAYQDVVGVWTIGWGETNPKHAFPGNVITKELADQLKWEYVNKDVQACNRLVKVPTSPEQQTAILSFCFNLGIPAFQRSTLLRKLNEGDYLGAWAEFPRWNRAGGKPVRGLTNRRKAEADLFLKGTRQEMFEQPKPKGSTKSNAQDKKPHVSSYAESNVVPATPPNPSNGAAAATGTVATAAMLKETSDGLAPLTPYSQYITYAFIVVTILALVYGLKKYRESRA